MFEVGSSSRPRFCTEVNPCTGEGALKFKENTEVVLVPVPARGSDYVGLSGACDDDRIGCTIRMDADKNVTAGFFGRKPL